MVFSSPTFVCLFLPLTLALYFLLPRSSNNLVLVAASIVFYGWGDPVAAFALILPSIVMNFISAGCSAGPKAQGGAADCFLHRHQSRDSDRIQILPVHRRKSQ